MDEPDNKHASYTGDVIAGSSRRAVRVGTEYDGVAEMGGMKRIVVQLCEGPRVRDSRLKNTLTHFIGKCAFIAGIVIGRDDKEIGGSVLQSCRGVACRRLG